VISSTGSPLLEAAESGTKVGHAPASVMDDSWVFRGYGLNPWQRGHHDHEPGVFEPHHLSVIE
jgi:hypothetical protein